MRLYHTEHGFHFETSEPVIAELKTLGWIEAPKGFQKTLKEPQVKEIEPQQEWIPSNPYIKEKRPTIKLKG